MLGTCMLYSSEVLFVSMLHVAGCHAGLNLPPLMSLLMFDVEAWQHCKQPEP